MFIMPKAPILSPVKMAQQYGTVIRVHISSKEPTDDDEPLGGQYECEEVLWARFDHMLC